MVKIPHGFFIISKQTSKHTKVIESDVKAYKRNRKWKIQIFDKKSRPNNSEYFAIKIKKEEKLAKIGKLVYSCARVAIYTRRNECSVTFLYI